MLFRQRHHWTPSSAKESFIKSSCRTLGRRGWLRSYMLFLNDVPSASLLGFAYNKKYYGYKAAFNPDFFAVCPGTAIFAYIIHNEIEQGIKEFDYLIGEYDYKQYWCNEIRYIDCIQIDSNNIQSRLKIYSDKAVVEFFRSIRRMRTILKRKIGRTKVKRVKLSKPKQASA